MFMEIRAKILFKFDENHKHTQSKNSISLEQNKNKETHTKAHHNQVDKEKTLKRSHK